MKFLKKLSKNEARHQRFTGLNFEQTNLLAQKITPLWNKAESKRLQRKDRKRKIGGGHPYTLKTIEEKISNYPGADYSE